MTSRRPGSRSATPMPVVMLCTSLGAAAVFVLVRRYVARHQHLEHAFAPQPTAASVG